MFGVINVNKPQGVTSRDVVNQIQRLVKPLKAGHAGTLDPLATGVLLVCIGDATRLVALLQERTKTYTAEFTLGQVSDTDDSTGQITQFPQPAILPDVGAITSGLIQLTGVVTQVPPAFSAIHVQGQRAYDLARSGAIAAVADHLWLRDLHSFHCARPGSATWVWRADEPAGANGHR